MEMIRMKKEIIPHINLYGYITPNIEYDNELEPDKEAILQYMVGVLFISNVLAVVISVFLVR